MCCRAPSFDLTIGETPMNFTGHVRTAVTVNGSLPAPILRWREGTTVDLRVSNALPAGSIHGPEASIHWHGILLPANMDGVPGLSFHGIHRGETYHYRFDSAAGRNLLVPQPLRLPGTGRTLRARSSSIPPSRSLSPTTANTW